MPVNEARVVSSITNRAISGRNSIFLYSTHFTPHSPSPLQRLEVHTHSGSTHYLAAWKLNPHSPRSHVQNHVCTRTANLLINHLFLTPPPSEEMHLLCGMHKSKCAILIGPFWKSYSTTCSIFHELFAQTKICIPDL